MAVKKKVNKNKYDISSIKRVTRNQVVVVQKTAKKCAKKVSCTCKVAFFVSRNDLICPEFE